MQKFIQIRHWDYWWGVYGCGTASPDHLRGVEFSLTDDEAGETLFFHLDLYNFFGLRETLWDGDLYPAESADQALFLRRAEELALGKAEFFVGALSYPDFTPGLAFCSQPLSPLRRLPDLKVPPAAPHYAVIYLAEERPLTPEILELWAARLSLPLFGRDFAARIARVPTRQEALASWQAEAAEPD